MARRTQESGEPGESGRTRFRRVLLALDTMSEGAAAVESAAALAGRLRAEFIALFVEDVDLVTLAEHPDASAVSTISARRHAIDADLVRRALRARQATRRRAIEDAAGRRQVKSSFVVRRGRVAAEVLASAEEADLVIMDWACGAVSLRPAGRGAPPGAVACAVAEASGRSVLLLRPGVAIGGAVLAAYDGSPAAAKALEAAAEVAENDGGTVDVALLTGKPSEAEAWQRDIAEGLAARRLKGHFLHVADATVERLGDLARQREVSLMVLGAGQPLIEGEAPKRLLERLDRSVLLVR